MQQSYTGRHPPGTWHKINFSILIARTAREREALMARNMMSNHTDMQDQYCGDCYEIHPIQSQYKGNQRRGGAAEGRVTSFVVAAAGRHLCTVALNRVNIVAVTTRLVLHVGSGLSEYV